ncbi:hypothetical protein TSO352_01795 [Azospirillum sp. TSO35-2]|nr:hypothetical protein TSO352_01795 [Azospirillum sp. TSO35-2]
MFSWVSNAASNVTGTAPQLAQFLSLAFGKGGSWTWTLGPGSPTLTVNGLIDSMGSQLIGQDWEITWGPAVYQNNDDNEADNALVVVYSPSQDSYVVAMAGTNPASAFDWVLEDAKVGPKAMVDFPLTDLSAPPVGGLTNPLVQQVTLGTATGIYNLLTQMVDQNGDTLDLAGYLTALKPASGHSGSKIIFTGHSLGGALSPTLAYQLLPSLTSWTTNGGSVCAMPTAGPTPGNGMFALKWGLHFGPTPVTSNTGNQVTTLNTPIFDVQDVVPCAWAHVIDLIDSYTTITYPNPACQAYFYDFNTKSVPVTLQTQTMELANEESSSTNKIATYFGGIATAAQGLGTAALVARLLNTKGLTGSFPLTYWNKTGGTGGTGGWSQYSLPTSTVTTSGPFLDAVALIHVWHYFQFFGIDPTQVTRTIQPAS